jgi:hypothetical protein
MMGELARRVTKPPRVMPDPPMICDPDGRQAYGGQPAVSATGAGVRRPRPRTVVGSEAPFAGLAGQVAENRAGAAAGLVAAAAGFAGVWALVTLIPDGLLFYVPLTGLLAVGAALLLGRRASARRQARVDQVLAAQVAAEQRRDELEQARERRPVPVRVDVEADEVVVDAEVVVPVALPSRPPVQVPPVVRRRVVA